MATALGVVLFLLVAPAVERDAHLAIVRDGEEGRLENSLRHLCWIGSGVTGLNELLPTLPIERRLLVLRHAVALDCLNQLQPRIRASYYIIDPEGARNLEKAVGYETEAIDPALEALASHDADVAKRGALVLAALARRMNGGQQTRAIERLREMPPSEERDRLARRLGLDPSVLRGAASGETGFAKDRATSEAILWESTKREEELLKERDAGAAVDAGADIAPAVEAEGDVEADPLVPPLREPTLEPPRSRVLYQRATDSRSEPRPGSDAGATPTTDAGRSSDLGGPDG